MKKIWIAVLLVLSLVTVCLAADKAAEKVEAPDSCVHCGMDRTKFGHSRMIVTYTDGSSAGTCSLNCVGVDQLKDGKDKTVKTYQVADANTRKLIDAKTATWVIGGSKKGVMTPVPKWAFAEKTDAAAFVKANGGKVITFDEALKAMQKEHEDKAKKAQDHKGHDHK